MHIVHHFSCHRFKLSSLSVSLDSVLWLWATTSSQFISQLHSGLSYTHVFMYLNASRTDQCVFTDQHEGDFCVKKNTTLSSLVKFLWWQHVPVILLLSKKSSTRSRHRLGSAHFCCFNPPESFCRFCSVVYEQKVVPYVTRVVFFKAFYLFLKEGYF